MAVPFGSSTPRFTRGRVEPPPSTFSNQRDVTSLFRDDGRPSLVRKLEVLRICWRGKRYRVRKPLREPVVCIHAANDLLANNGVGAQVYPDDPLADVHVSRDAFNSADPRLLAHELGHAYLSLLDEYLGPDDARNTSPPPKVLQTLCGHSMMSIHNGPSNNLCTSWDHGFNRLFTSPHPSSVSPPMPAAWTTLHSLFGFDVPVGTPDNYNYADHDFGGAISVSPP